MFSIQVLGLADLEASLVGLPVALEDAEMLAMDASVKLVEATAKGKVPRRTGQLAASIQSKVSNQGPGFEGSVGTNAMYAPFVEEGSRPHEISPVTAMALLTDIGVFSHVQHPGTSAEPYLAPALNDNRPEILEIFRVAAQTALSLVHGV